MSNINRVPGFRFTRESRFRVGLGLLLIVVFGVAAIDAAGFQYDARLFPLGVSLTGLVVAGVVCCVEVWKAWKPSPPTKGFQNGTRPSKSGLMDVADDVSSFRALFEVFGYIALFVVLIILFGTYIAMAVSVAIYLHLRTSMSWISFSVAVALPVGFLYALEVFATLEWPSSVLFN